LLRKSLRKKGKIEAFNKQLDIFIAEAALAKPKSLDELNNLLNVWLNEYYHKKPHTSLNGVSPEIAFKTSPRPLNYVDARLCAEAFLHSCNRKVDKTGCIKFDGKVYEVGVALIAQNVEVFYDPLWTDEIEIRAKDRKPFKSKVLEIGENCGVRSEFPENLTGVEPETSRMLDGLNKANITHRTRKNIAVNYKDLGGDNE